MIKKGSNDETFLKTAMFHKYMQEEGQALMTDEGLIELARDGDLEAFDDLMKKYYPVVERFAFQLGNSIDTVDDIAQEVFLRVYRYLHQYSHGKFTTWLYTITLNVSRDMGRKRKQVLRSFQGVLREPNESGTLTDDAVLKDERDQELHRSIQQLKEKYKIPIVLFYFHEKKIDDIAEIMNIPVGTVKTRLSRAKSQLKAAIGEGGHIHEYRSF